MIHRPMDVLARFPIRKSKKQKQAFREAIAAYAGTLGYECNFEKGSLGARNIVMGNPETARYLVTAHYDTPAGMLLPNFITPCNPVMFLLYQFMLVGLFVVVSIAAGIGVGVLTKNEELAVQIGLSAYWGMLILMIAGPGNRSNANDNTSGVVSVLQTMQDLPEGQRSKVCFVLFDLEEAGLVGSSSFRKVHKKASETQLVLNMDCVGNGNEILLFPSKKLKKDAAAMEQLRRICGSFGEKTVSLREKGFSYYPSDQKSFPLGVGIAAFRRSKFIGLYCDRIHTWRDTVLEEENVTVLSRGIVKIISGTTE